MKKIFILALTFSLVLQFNTEAQKLNDKNLFRIMTFNIRYSGGEANTDINSWNNRKALVASVIRFNKPDIFGVQEALDNQMTDLTNELPDYNFIGVGRDDGKKGGEYSAIFYNNKRFEMLDHSTFWLSQTPDKVSRGWDAACNRIVTWGKFKDERNGKIFYHFNTHFDHVGKIARMKSAELLLNKINEIAGKNPVLVTGDFNLTSASPVYKKLTLPQDSDASLILSDAELISKEENYGTDKTINGFKYNTKPGRKIDYIFIKNNISVYQHGVIGVVFNGRYPSDHMPVLAEVEIE